MKSLKKVVTGGSCLYDVLYTTATHAEKYNKDSETIGCHSQQPALMLYALIGQQTRLSTK